MIEIKDLAKAFALSKNNKLSDTEKQDVRYSKEAFHSVRNVSFSCGSGEVLGLLGPNGAGKTTTFYMIVGLVPSDKGTISLNDKDITFDPIHARARQGIGYLPQESSIFRKLTVHDNLLAILQTRKDLTPAKREEVADDLLEEFHIGHIKNSLGMSLSGGERRRLVFTARRREQGLVMGFMQAETVWTILSVTVASFRANGSYVTFRSKRSCRESFMAACASTRLMAC